MRQRLFRPLLVLFFPVLALLFAPAPCFPQSQPTDTTPLDDAVRQFAERVTMIPNLHGPVRLQFLQDTDFAADTGKDWQETFRQEIEKRRLTATEDPAANLLRVGLAETPTQVILSAGVRVSGNEEVRLLSFPRSAFRVANLPSSTVRVEKQLLYQSSDRILDASFLWNGAETDLALLAYRNAELLVLRLDADGRLKQSISLAAAGVRFSRDPRGELTVRSNDASVFLLGKSCEFSWSSPSEAKCRAARSTWRSATVLTPACDAGGWKLLVDGSDWTTPGLLQVIPEGAPQRRSAALLSDFPGPILNINGEQSRASALAVTRNLRTGNYEVYKITLVCGN